MFRIRNKASVRSVDKNCARRGLPHTYPSGRTCWKCGTKLSIYNGMAECNPCWTSKHIPLETEESFDLECALIERTAGAR